MRGTDRAGVQASAWLTVSFDLRVWLSLQLAMAWTIAQVRPGPEMAQICSGSHKVSVWPETRDAVYVVFGEHEIN